MPPVSPEEQRRLRRFRSRLFRWLCVTGVLLLLILAVTPWYGLKWNASASLDGYLYLIEMHTHIDRGDIILFKTPQNALHNDHDFGKYVAGVSGDSIVVKGREFYSGDKYLGLAKTHSLEGVPLKPSMAEGEHIIPDGMYFVWTHHKDSYDSRYEDIGLIENRAVIGRLHRIF